MSSLIPLLVWSTSKGGKELSAGLECGDHAFALGNINTDSVHVNPSKTIDLLQWCTKLLIADSIY